MYQLHINQLSHSEFLAQYWQKKPLLIKQGFKDFTDPLDANELAGLAMEDEIESRIVTNHHNNWQIHHGAFTDFDALSDTHSTLLVQAVDHWHNQAAQLLEPFRFIPNWRIDDLMVSYSTPKGGVGPHLDQYDVFIIQGQGKRHWRVGLPDLTLKQFSAKKGLLQVEPFEAVIDVILEAGDILYIPPACPHEGYAIENAINYSVGFRAPNQVDLLSSLADHLIDHDLGQTRYQDANLTLRPSRGELTTGEKQAVHSLLTGVLNEQDTFSQWLGNTLTQAKHEMDIAPLEDEITPDELADFLSHSLNLIKLAGLRCIYQQLESELLFSVNGQSFTLPNTHLAAVKMLTDTEQVASSELLNATSCLLFREMLTTLINEGFWYID